MHARAGFGGTQRLPRLVGLKKAIQMMLTSTPIKDGEARKLGLLDDVVPQVCGRLCVWWWWCVCVCGGWGAWLLGSAVLRCAD
jgi:enoyl-CoA hydratase/carnithine racemase